MYEVEKSTLDSLVYYCFGFTIDEDEGTVLDRIVEKAYADATGQGAFNTKADPDKAKTAKYDEHGSKKALVEQIGHLLDEEQVDFDGWHASTCEMLVRIYKDHGLGENFKYGNAQKWVNMSLKYLYLLSGIYKDATKMVLNRISAIRRYADLLHVPIDSFIIDVLWMDSTIQLPLKGSTKLTNRGKQYAIPSEYVKGWSNWNKDEYIVTQQSMESLCNPLPIEWETNAWIQRAKVRRNKQKTISADMKGEKR